jgi:hypothetical protein
VGLLWTRHRPSAVTLTLLRRNSDPQSQLAIGRRPTPRAATGTGRNELPVDHKPLLCDDTISLNKPPTAHTGRGIQAVQLSNKQNHKQQTVLCRCQMNITLSTSPLKPPACLPSASTQLPCAQLSRTSVFCTPGVIQTLQYTLGIPEHCQEAGFYTVRSESRCALRLRYVDMVVSIEVVVEVCRCFTVFSC